SGLLATDNCPEENIVEYRYFADNRYRIGSTRIGFGSNYADSNDEDQKETDINGEYIVDSYEPIQDIDPITGVPNTNNHGEIIYKKIPDEECDIHGAETTDDLIN